MLFLRKRIVNNSKLNFNLHLIIILTFTNDGEITVMSWTIQFKSKSNQQKKCLCPLTERNPNKFSDSMLNFIQSLVYFTHFFPTLLLGHLLSSFYITMLSSNH